MRERGFFKSDGSQAKGIELEGARSEEGGLFDGGIANEEFFEFFEVFEVFEVSQDDNEGGIGEPGGIFMADSSVSAKLVRSLSKTLKTMKTETPCFFGGRHLAEHGSYRGN